MGALGIAGTSLSLSRETLAEGVERKKEEGEEGAEIENVEDVFITPRLPKNNYVILEEGLSISRSNVQDGKHALKCKFESSSVYHYCVLTKVVKNPNDSNGWVSLSELKAIPYEERVPLEYLDDEDAVYKARLLNDLIVVWQKNLTNRLVVHLDNAAKPLMLLKPVFAAKSGSTFRGYVEYAVVKATEDFDASNKFFKCHWSPVQPQTYQNCEIYKFDADSSAEPATLNDKVLTDKLTVATSIKKDAHYLIKLQEKALVDASRFDAANLTIKVQSFTDPNRTGTSEDAEKTFAFVAPTAIFEEDGKIQLAVVHNK